MTTYQTKQIGQNKGQEHVTIADTLHDTWRVMKPFVRFSYKALKIIGHTLVYIVKHIPKPEDQKKSDKVIKI